MNNAEKGAPPVAPGLLAWIEDACDWELNRRIGLDYTLLLPLEAAIPPEETALSIDAAIAPLATFGQDSPRVLALFDAVVSLLSGGKHGH